MQSLPLLTPDEARQVLDAVDRHRSAWLPVPRQGGDLDRFATLGSATYIDHGSERLGELVAAGNAVLIDAFGGLIDRVRSALRAALGRPVGPPPDGVGLPGFHVFGPANRLVWGGSLHLDLQGLQLAQRLGRSLDPGDEWSFTLPVALPSSGATLELWDRDRRDPLGPPKLASDRPTWVHRYQLGVLALHRGDHYHRIGPVPNEAQLRRRVTLQGHVAALDGSAFAYW
jgi:hypothetical protein